MKIIHSLIIIGLGAFILTLGAITKIIHLELGLLNGNLLLNFGLFTTFLGFIVLVYKLITGSKLKNV